MSTPCRVLFLCTGNSARSILAEALLNHLGHPHFTAYSAGSHPAGSVHPLALATLRQRGIPIGRPRSKGWEEFALPDGASPALDLIITVCDNAAGESCPVWPGRPASAHWGLPDPAAVQGSESLQAQAFQDTFETLRSRIQALVSLPIAELGQAGLRKRLNELSQPRVSRT